MQQATARKAGLIGLREALQMEPRAAVRYESEHLNPRITRLFEFAGLGEPQVRGLGPFVWDWHRWPFDIAGDSKRRNVYIRTLLVHGSRCMLRFFKDPDTAIGRWAVALKSRAHANVAAVALANKQARTAWALLTQGTFYQARPAV